MIVVLTDLAKLRRQLLSDIDKSLRTEAASVARAQARRKEQTKHQLAELKALDAVLTGYLQSHRASLWRRYGKVIKLPDAVIRYRTGSKSLDTPKNNDDLVAFLLSQPGGKRYLTVKYTLNRDAITQAGKSLRPKLRRFGIWVGRHATITITSTGQAEPTTLARRRYRERRWQ
jgi:hypothetical protein